MLDTIKSLAFYALLLALILGCAWMVPRFFTTVAIPAGYVEIDGLQELASKRIDKTAKIGNYARGQGVCYRLGSDSSAEARFAYVAALPGDQIAVRDGKLVVNGTVFARAPADHLLSTAGPTVVPAGHLFVVTNTHESDSFRQGPIPAAALYGRIEEFP
ncbi:MAG: S26 family signal peptidase [Planctomycetes bacterium]|nr:S26 family signal peptidase [Planctomycetota bacterium]